ncbi:MAG: hypothetical protein H6707_02895 [Deltaproteobacteria bacterium]|nr:hypothetical protein [Deltaproteobacteria bacterium]
MSLTIGTQLSTQGAILQGTLASATGASGFSKALQTQFFQQQASLILNRTSGEERAVAYQETLSRATTLERAARGLMARPGHYSLFAERSLTSTDETIARGYADLWATPKTFTVEVTDITGSDITYKIDDGQEIITSDQKVTIDNGITIHLLAVGSATISVAPQTSEITAAVESYVDSFNDLFSFVTANPSELTTPLADDLNDAASIIESQLSSIGISRDDDGLFSVDTTELASWLNSEFSQTNLEKVRSALTGPAGLVTKASRIAADFVDEPASYVTDPINPVDTYNLTRQHQYETRGLLINLIG